MTEKQTNEPLVKRRHKAKKQGPAAGVVQKHFISALCAFLCACFVSARTRDGVCVCACLCVMCTWQNGRSTPSRYTGFGRVGILPLESSFLKKQTPSCESHALRDPLPVNLFLPKTCRSNRERQLIGHPAIGLARVSRYSRFLGEGRL